MGPLLHLLDLIAVIFSVQIEKFSGEARRRCPFAAPATDPGEDFLRGPDHKGEDQGIPELRGQAQQPDRLHGDRNEEASGVRR